MASFWDLIWSGPQVDTTLRDLIIKEAEEAKALEAARQERIRTGTEAVNQQFSKFDDSFYNQRRDAMMNFYQPQLNDQVADARKALTYAFARAGTLNSSMSGERNADLTKNYDLQKGQLVSTAQSDQAALKSSIGNNKNAIMSQLNATADANLAADQASAQTKQIYETIPSYSPLGDIFAGVTNGIGSTFNSLNNIDFNRAYYGGSGGGGNNTYRTVRT